MWPIPPNVAIQAIREKLGHRVAPWPSDGGAAVELNWLGDDDDATKGLERLSSAVSPLLGALMLAGYEVQLVAATPIVGGVSHEHVVLDVGTATYTPYDAGLDTAVGAVLPPGDLVLAFDVRPRRRFRTGVTGQVVGSNLAMDLPSLRAHPSGTWHGTGDQVGPWDLLHDPTPVAPAGDGWWLVGAAAGSDGGLAAMAAAADDAARQLGVLIAYDLADAWAATPQDAPLPGLLGLYDVDTWHQLDGRTPFSDRLWVIGSVLQAWLGRTPAGSDPPSTLATSAETVEFFTSECVAPSSDDTDGRPLPRTVGGWIDVATGTGGGTIVTDGTAKRAADVTPMGRAGTSPSPRRLERLFDLPWSQALLGLHVLGLVDVLGREQIGEVTQPEWIDIDATGTFERRDPSDPFELDLVGDGTDPDDTGVATDTLQLKVAGNRMVGFWQEHERLKLSPRSDTSHRIEAWRDSNATTFSGTATNLATGDMALCTLSPRVHEMLVLVDLTIEDDGGGSVSRTFVRTTDQAFLSDSELARIPPSATALVSEVHRHPLHTHEVNELLAVAEGLREDLDANLGGAMDATTVEARFDADITPYWAGDRLGQARAVLRRELRARTVLVGGWPRLTQTVDYVVLMNRMVQNSDEPLPTLTAFFELSPELYQYGWKLSAGFLRGAGVNVWVIGGTLYWAAGMTIEKRRFSIGQDPVLVWSHDYWAVFAGSGVSPPQIPAFELTSGMAGSGVSAWVRHDVSPAWFGGLTPGIFLMAGPQAGVVATPVGWVVSWLNGPTFLQETWFGAFAGLVFVGGSDADGSNVLWTNASGWGELQGLYVGFEVASNAGFLWEWDTDDPRPPVLDPQEVLSHIAETQQVTYAGPGDGSRFFDTDVSEVDAETRDWLREFCLEHLHLLRDRRGTLVLVGFADPRGDGTYNAELSLARAASVWQVFSDILGPHLAIPEEQTFVGGRGEWESVGEEHPEAFAGERRVDLYLNGVRVVSVGPAGGA